MEIVPVAIVVACFIGLSWLCQRQNKLREKAIAERDEAMNEWKECLQKIDKLLNR